MGYAAFDLKYFLMLFEIDFCIVYLIDEVMREDFMLYFFFGLAGSGKTYAGQRFAEDYGYHFEDADQWLTPEMQEAIQKAQPFTQAMRDRYFEIIIEKIKLLQKEYPDLVIAQACYKEKNRQQLREAFSDIQFVLINASKETLVRRLLIRKSEATLEYANQIARQFESPNEPVIQINNDLDYDDEYLRDQFECVFRSSPVNSKTSLKIGDYGFAKALTLFGSSVSRRKPAECLTHQSRWFCRVD